jgi:RNA recognition motif-containing protein
MAIHQEFAFQHLVGGDIFGKYGAIRQIRIGTNEDTRATAFVVYKDIYDAKNAVDHLSGFNFSIAT